LTAVGDHQPVAVDALPRVLLRLNLPLLQRPAPEPLRTDS